MHHKRQHLVRAARGVTMVSGAPGGLGLRDDFALLHDGETILAAGPFAELAAGHDGPAADLGDVTLAPGLLNAHCHLELSHLAGKTTAGQGFMPWVEHLLSLPLYEFDAAEVLESCRTMRRDGTTFVADISTRNAGKVAGVLQDSGFFFVSFTEAIGETMPAGGHLAGRGHWENGRAAVAGHALYTTSEAVLLAAKAECDAAGLPFSLHLSEHEDEVNILLGRHSEFLELLQSRGRLTGYKAPGKRPVAVAHDLGLLDERTLAVHCVQIDDADIELLRASGATICLCPRSNEFIGVGRAPWERLRAAGIPLCLGTDSIASNHDLNLWNEALYLAERFEGDLPPAELLAMLTTIPARAMGAADRLGTLEAGKAARWSVLPKRVECMFQEASPAR